MHFHVVCVRHVCNRSMNKLEERDYSPSVPDQQPADIEAQIDAPANEEAVWQHCRAAVHVPISCPLKKNQTNKKETFSHQKLLPTSHPLIPNG